MEKEPSASPLSHDEIERDILGPLRRPVGRVWWISVLALGTVFLWGLLAWAWQIYRGLGVTGMNAPVFWGFYISNFVFFIGISHAGTLVSAILRLTKARWRYPLTRVAEAITLFSLPSVITTLPSPSTPAYPLSTDRLAGSANPALSGEAPANHQVPYGIQQTPPSIHPAPRPLPGYFLQTIQLNLTSR